MAVEQYTSKYTRKEIETGIDDVKGRVTNVESRIGTVEGNTSGLGELTNRVSVLERGIQGVQSGVENAQKGVQGVQQELYGLQDRVISLEGWQGYIHPRIEGIQSYTDALKGWQSGVQSSVGGLQTNVSALKGWQNGVQSSINTLTTKVDILYGKLGVKTTITPSGNTFELNPDYHFNILSTTATNQKIELTSAAINRMSDGQELYVFVTGTNEFILSVSNEIAIIGLDGEKINNGSTISPSTVLVEISIIKIGNGAYVRLA